jgi:hypothetical protein
MDIITTKPHESTKYKCHILNSHVPQSWSQNERCGKVPTQANFNVPHHDKVLPQCHM